MLLILPVYILEARIPDDISRALKFAEHLTLFLSALNLIHDNASFAAVNRHFVGASSARPRLTESTALKRHIFRSQTIHWIVCEGRIIEFVFMPSIGRHQGLCPWNPSELCPEPRKGAALDPQAFEKA